MSVEYREGVMQEFIRKHEARIHGVLSCFDRMLFRGYLPIMSGSTDVMLWALPFICATKTFQTSIPKSPHNLLRQMQRTHAGKIYALRSWPKPPSSSSSSSSSSLEISRGAVYKANEYRR